MGSPAGPSAQCCPASGHGGIGEPAGFQPKGAMEDVSGTSCYVVGAGSSAVVVAHDVFGLRSGRTRKFCDDLAESLGVLVVVPEFWNECTCGGEASNSIDCFIADPKSKTWGRWLKEVGSAIWNTPRFLSDLRAHNWEVCGPKLQDRILPMLREKGVQKLGCLGFCWGGWFVMHACAIPEFRCGVTLHPSQAQVCKVVGEDFRQVCESVQCPQLVLSANDDGKETKEGGLANQVWQTKSFGTECVFKTFADMRHGWANRGDLRDEKIARDFAETVTRVEGFFRKHLLEADGEIAPAAQPSNF